MSFKGVKGEIMISEVRGIGGAYGLTLDEEDTRDDRPRPLPAPVAVRFFRMDGKQVEEAAVSGEITAVSKKQAILKTDAEAAVFDNLRLDVCGELDAKVTGCESNAGGKERFLRLTFTAKPEGFSAWVRRILEGGTE